MGSNVPSISDAKAVTRREVISVSLAFFLVSATLIGIMSNWRPGSNLFLGPDQVFSIWSLKWWPHSLLELHNPFHAPFFYPDGQNLAWTGAVPTLAILMAPITLWMGPVFAYNLINVLALSGNGILAYLIARDFECKKLPALISATLFYFSSYTWGQLLGHLNLCVTIFAVATIYLTARRVHRNIGRLKYICLIALLLALQFGVSNEVYATLIVFAAVAVALFVVLVGRSAFQDAIDIAYEMVIGTLASVVLLTPYLYQIFAHHTTGLQDVSAYVADPLNYVIPTQTNWLLGNSFKPLSERFSGNITEQGAYLGLPILILLVIAGRGFYEKVLNRWLLALLIAVCICSLGSNLTIQGIPTVWLPWSWVQALPLIREALPARFSLYSSLLASILVGRILTGSSSFHLRIFAGLAVAALLPNLGMYRASAVPRDPFFADGTYSQVISRGSNVLILPTYGFDGYQPAFWQAESGFWFNVSDGLAGKVPARLSRYLWYYYGGQEPGSARLGLLHFLKDTQVEFVLSDDRSKDTLSEIYRGIGFAYEQYGHVQVARISPTTLNNMLKIEGSEESRHVCRLLVRLAQYGFEYEANGGDLVKLSPSAVADTEFEKDFGSPLPVNSPAFNWTSKGYWLGSWNGSVAVGFSPVDSVSAAALYKLFQNGATYVFYPYPSVFNGTAEPSEIGQLLVALKSNPLTVNHCDSK